MTNSLHLKNADKTKRQYLCQHFGVPVESRWYRHHPDRLVFTTREGGFGIILGNAEVPRYLEGRPFTLVTDHKPLQYTMAPGKAVHSTAATARFT